MDFQKFALGVLAIAALAAIFADSLATSVTAGRNADADAAAPESTEAEQTPASLQPPRTRETMEREAEQAAAGEGVDDDDEGAFGDPLADGEPAADEDGQSLWDADTEPAVSLDQPDLDLDNGPEALDADVEVQLPRQRKTLG